MVQCSRCRNQVDETTRKTCPTCLTPLPVAAAPLSSAAPASPATNAIPLAAPKSSPVPPVQAAPYGASPLPGYAPPMPQHTPPAYAPLSQNGYAPQPGVGVPPYPGAPNAQPGMGMPPYPGAAGTPGIYAPPNYAGRPPSPPPPPVQQPRSSGGSAFGGTFPWWRLCFIVSAVGRACYWGTHQDRTDTPTYTPATTHYATPAPIMPAAPTPTFVRPAYVPPPAYQVSPPSFSSGPYGYGQSHFTPPPMPQPRFIQPPMPTSHFGPGPRFGR